jgi:Icc protein
VLGAPGSNAVRGGCPDGSVAARVPEAPDVARHPELFGVGTDEALVTFTTDPGVAVTTTVGPHEITTAGPNHIVRATGLDPATDYDLRVDGTPSSEYLPATFRTLARPSGELLATIATTNDVHFGEKECGHLGPPHEDIGPIFRVEAGEEPYPETMSRAAVSEIATLDPDVVIVKGDLTSRGTPQEYEAFLGAYSMLGARMRHVRGNHDAMQDPQMAIEGAPYAIEVEGLTLAVLDTVIPGTDSGQVTADQIHWLDALGAETTGPVLVFGHHYVWDLDSADRNPHTFGINPDDSEALAAVITRRENIAGYFAGHTHRNRIRRFARVRDMPLAEVACTKDYPGAWAEYCVYEGGYTQVVRRVTEPDAFAWAEKTRGMFAGVYRDYALGPLEHRCFAQIF